MSSATATPTRQGRLLTLWTPEDKQFWAREGEAVTILAYGTMVHVALAAARETGIDAEVIDLRTLSQREMVCSAE